MTSQYIPHMVIVPTSTNEITLDDQGFPLNIPEAAFPQRGTYTQEQMQTDFDNFQDEEW